MAKTKQEINPKCANRLKTLCKRFNTTQTAISEATFISQNTLSKIAQGKAPMTYNIASLIAEKYPVSIEWLMGNSEFMTESDKGLQEFIEWGTEEQARRLAVKSLVFLSGYEIEDIYDFARSKELQPIEELLKFNRRGYPIKQNGETIAYISPEKFNLLALDIQELAELRIKSYLREVSEDG